jgi:hypothetical protein
MSVLKVSTGAVQGDVEYRDGSHMWVSIPRLDMYDYHPLSVTSSPCFPEWRRTMLLQCKVYDKWTQARPTPLHLVRLEWNRFQLFIDLYEVFVFPVVVAKVSQHSYSGGRLWEPADVRA